MRVGYWGNLFVNNENKIVFFIISGVFSNAELNTLQKLVNSPTFGSGVIRLSEIQIIQLSRQMKL